MKGNLVLFYRICACAVIFTCELKQKFCKSFTYIITSEKEIVFTALHGMQRGLNDEISVRLSVRPSVCLSNACIVTKRKKDMF